MSKATTGAVLGGLAAGGATIALGGAPVLIGALGAGAGAVIGAVKANQPGPMTHQECAGNIYTNLQYARMNDPQLYRKYAAEVANKIYSKKTAHATFVDLSYVIEIDKAKGTEELDVFIRYMEANSLPKHFSGKVKASIYGPYNERVYQQGRALEALKKAENPEYVPARIEPPKPAPYVETSRVSNSSVWAGLVVCSLVGVVGLFGSISSDLRDTDVNPAPYTVVSTPEPARASLTGKACREAVSAIEPVAAAHYHTGEYLRRSAKLEAQNVGSTAPFPVKEALGKASRVCADELANGDWNEGRKIVSDLLQIML